MNPFGSRGKVFRSSVLLVLLAGLIAVAEGQHDKKSSSSPAPRPAPAPHMSAPAQHAPANRTAPTNHPPTNTRPSTGMGNRPNTTMGIAEHQHGESDLTTPPWAEGRTPEPRVNRIDDDGQARSHRNHEPAKRHRNYQPAKQHRSHQPVNRARDDGQSWADGECKCQWQNGDPDEYREPSSPWPASHASRRRIGGDSSQRTDPHHQSQRDAD